MASSERDPFAPDRILVTGGLGFIGSHLVRALLDARPESQVVNLDLETYAADWSRLEDLKGQPRLQHVRGDVADAPLVAQLLGDFRIQAVLHLAAETHVDRSIADAAPFVRTNVLGTQTLLEGARRVWVGQEGVRFVHVSTDEVFGDLGPEDPPFTEGSPYAPSSPYSASKAAADHFVAAAWRTHGIPALVVHPSNAFGPGQHAEKFLPTLVRTATAGREVPIYGSGRQVRDWMHVGDLVAALLRILDRGRPGERYLVGAGNEWENLALAQEVMAILDRLSPGGAPHARHLVRVADRPGHDRRYAVNASRLRRELGWSPARRFEQALEETITWFVGRAPGGFAPPGGP